MTDPQTAAQPYLTPKMAEQVWEVLAEECGASEHVREDFLVSASLRPRSDHHPLEYRFQGALGFGGKVYVHPTRPMWVSQYPEDETAATRKMVQRANVRLAEVGGSER